MKHPPLFRLHLRAGKDNDLNHKTTNIRIGEDGHIYAKNISGYWLPDFKLQREIGGTVYTVSGSYEGMETLDSKLHRILIQDTGDIHDK